MIGLLKTKNMGESMRSKKIKFIFLSGLLGAFGLSNGLAEERNTPDNLRQGQAVRYDQSQPLPELIRLSRENADPSHLKPPGYVYPNFVEHPERINQADRTRPVSGDPSLQNYRGGNLAPPIELSFDGIGQSDAPGGGLPPDTNGDVGLQYYVQYINTDWAVFDKSNGNLLSSVLEGNVFWNGFGGPCETNNAGDPIVLYDKVANVWVFSQFISASNPNGSQCFAVSDRQDLLDPEVTFYRYQFEFVGQFNDYPHIGIWTDVNGASSGYYFVTHDFTFTPSTSFLGASFSVVERDKMLQGEPAQFVRFPQVTAQGSAAYGALPAHLESVEVPDTSTCAPFVHNRSDLDGYLLWLLCVNWNSVADSFLTDAQFLSANSAFVGGVNDIAQPAPAPEGATLDSLSNRTMYRASARAYPTESGLPLQMVINHVADAGEGQSGVRWVDFEMSFPGIGSGVDDRIFMNGFESVESLAEAFQARILDQGLFAPDSENRWMAGISIDQSTNIGVAYSVASESVFPSVRYSGRTSGDPVGELRDEQTCVAGGGVQTWVDPNGGASRWGDYSSMSVDPVDQCTFWASIEYVAATGLANWENRVCSFRFPECGDPSFILRTSTPQEINVCTLTDNPVIDLNLYALSGFSNQVTLSSSGLTGGASLSFQNNMVSNYPASTQATFNNLNQVSSPEFQLIVSGSSTSPVLNRDVMFNMSVSTVIAGATTLQLPADGGVGQAVRPELSWSSVNAAMSYKVEVATDVAFTDIVETGISLTNSYLLANPLESQTQYYWRVTTVNNCGDGAVSSVFNFTTGVPGTCPVGTAANIVFFDDLEGDVSDWSTPPDPVGSGNTWAISNVQVNSGTAAFLAVDSADTSDQYLVSPPIVLPASSESPITLSFWNFQNIEANTGQGVDACWDGGLLEISTDGGNSFIQIPNSNLLTDAYNGNAVVQAPSPISGLDAWCADDIVPASGDQETVSIVDINDYAGQTVQFRFRLGTDGASGDEGWYIDDVTVQSCQ